MQIAFINGKEDFFVRKNLSVTVRRIVWHVRCVWVSFSFIIGIFNKKSSRTQSSSQLERD